MYKNDKREYIDNLAKKAQRAADFGNMKITKQLDGKYNKCVGEIVKAKYSRILTTENEDKKHILKKY